MRNVIVIVLALAATGCGFLEQINFGGSGIDPNKIYLTDGAAVSVSPRETYRYACFDRPVLCVQHGLSFECRCP